MRIQVTLHNPLFGEDYVTRVVLLDPLHEEGGSTHPLPSHNDTEVRLCCESCLADFNKEPAKYMAKLKP